LEEEEATAWNPFVHQFFSLVSRPVLVALSPGYQHGTRLDDAVKQTLKAFSAQLGVDGDAVEALKRPSGVDAIRILTIHKCKGLEFEKVVLLGAEEQLFGGTPPQ
jgi:superfamily I DNA/RNA helicase